jgi:hypothetical protein
MPPTDRPHLPGEITNLPPGGDIFCTDTTGGALSNTVSA